ncbi:acyltransferase [Clostridium fungisolvens]|uniref:Acyltransferase 3 domain-containing protein n=1 Tax=Clostridium fungisolvens TaxID=1604897 RepID=A0A6V8SGF1_9CLOT|nr:acyltransferase family protein [Clostridium fungisolvens]GFP76294.1 hypothetical protein bsdtw1_02396 [Clostridium fungisolvens]
MKENRSIGLDIVRASAIIFVVSVHFFLNTKYYETPIVGASMYIQTYIRMACIMCVPLFLILTGYLQKNKQPSKSYFKKILPILVIYLFYSLLCIIFRSTILNERPGILNWLVSIGNFSADSYSWYIQMYIGLFLLSPFLNVCYNNLKGKRHKTALVIIALFMTAFPATFNGKFGGFINFPSSWQSIYPITYYFIGCYINEFKPRIKKVQSLLLLFGIILLETFIEIYGSHLNGQKFSSYVGGYDSLIITIEAVVFFLVFYDIALDNELITKAISIISLLSLDIYLVSRITDTIVYNQLFKHYFVSQERVILFFMPTLLCTFSLAFIIASMRNKIIKVR